PRRPPPPLRRERMPPRTWTSAGRGVEEAWGACARRHRREAMPAKRISASARSFPSAAANAGHARLVEAVVHGSCQALVLEAASAGSPSCSDRAPPRPLGELIFLV